MNTHMVLDLETLALSPDAVILQMAACTFSTEADCNEQSSLNVHLDTGIQIEQDRSIDIGTVKFWMKQSSRIRRDVLSGGSSPDEALELLFKFVIDNNVKRVWCRGTDFDIALMRHFADQNGVVLPWKYNHVRDLRTLFEIAGDLVDHNEATVGIVGDDHDALYDCCRDAAIARQCLIALSRS